MSKTGCSCGIEMTVTMLIGIASGCIVGFVLGWLWRDRPGTLADVRLLDLMTAVGTVGAAAGAVAIAWWQTYDRRNEKRSEALHVLAAASSRLTTLKTQLEQLIQDLEGQGVVESCAAWNGTIVRLRTAIGDAFLPEPRDLLALGVKYSSALSRVNLSLEKAVQEAEFAIATNRTTLVPQLRQEAALKCASSVRKSLPDILWLIEHEVSELVS